MTISSDVDDVRKPVKSKNSVEYQLDEILSDEDSQLITAHVLIEQALHLPLVKSRRNERFVLKRGFVILYSSYYNVRHHTRFADYTGFANIPCFSSFNFKDCGDTRFVIIRVCNHARFDCQHTKFFIVQCCSSYEY